MTEKKKKKKKKAQKLLSNAWKWKVKSESEVAQSCPTPSDPMDCSPPGSSIHGIFQARVLEWGAIAFSKLYFIVPIKSTTTMQGGGKGEGNKKKKKSKRIYRTSQNIRIINVFHLFHCCQSLSLVGRHSTPHLPRMPSNTVLVSGPAVGAAQILI